jgi:hypothetical protein
MSIWLYSSAPPTIILGSVPGGGGGVGETTVAREWAAKRRKNPMNAVSVAGIFIVQIRLQHLLEVEIVPSVIENQDADQVEPPDGDGLNGD